MVAYPKEKIGSPVLIETLEEEEPIPPAQPKVCVNDEIETPTQRIHRLTQENDALTAEIRKLRKKLERKQSPWWRPAWFKS